MNRYFRIKGGNRLEGKVRINGAKNSALPLMIATILTNEKVILKDIPHIKDVEVISSILERLGAKVSYDDKKKEDILIDNTETQYKDLMYEDVTKLRASYYFIGALLSRYGRVKILLPGGCFLGERPIDLHIKGFEALGCKIIESKSGNFDSLEVISNKKKLQGNHIFLDFPSVGATINILLAASLASGTTIIENAAKEPEIVDVAMLLNQMGAKIKGVGTDIIRIEGVESLSGCEHTVIPDRIEAGTYIMYGAMLSDNLTVENIIPEHLEALFSKLKEIGIKLDIGDDFIHILGKKENLKSIVVKTGVHPSFPTDLQQIMTTLLTQIEGKSEVEDIIYPERFRNCEYLNQMGANIELNRKIDSGKALINGKTALQGKEVIATDLRAGAGLILAGLLAKGVTEIQDINHILRGYDDIVYKLRKIGAEIELIEEEVL